MEQYRVPLRSVRVSVRLEDGQVLDGDLSIPEAGEASSRVRAADRLNDDDAFVPFSRADETDLLNKDRIVWVRIQDPELHDDGAGSRAMVRLALLDGGEVDGELHYAMPRERERVLDYLNAAPRFLELFEPDGVRLVQRHHIVRVNQLG